MNERKYRYKEAKNTKEHIEAIYEDLTYSSNKKHITEKTLKEYVFDILSVIKLNNINYERKEKSDEDSVQSSLMLLAIFSLFIALSTRGDDWRVFSEYQYSVKLFGIILSLIFIGVSIERTSFFRIIWNFGFTKFIVSVTISALIIFCTSKASRLINLIFSVDASAFPYTRAYLIGVLVFEYISPFLIVIAVFSILHALNIWDFIKSMRRESYSSTEIPIASILFLVLSIILFYFSYRWLKYDFSEKEYPNKIYKLAHVLDFNSKHPCLNIDKNTKVIFLDSSYNKVLIDQYGTDIRDIKSIIDKDSTYNYIPNEFSIISCQLNSK